MMSIAALTDINVLLGLLLGECIVMTPEPILDAQIRRGSGGGLATRRRTKNGRTLHRYSRATEADQPWPS
jgi:hypothetical protein